MLTAKNAELHRVHPVDTQPYRCLNIQSHSEQSYAELGNHSNAVNVSYNTNGLVRQADKNISIIALGGVCVCG